MSIINLSSIINPISNESPCGEDISSSDELSLIKAKRKFVETRSMDRWVEKKDQSAVSPLENKAIFELCLEILETKSKNLQIVAFMFEDLIKVHHLEGLAEGLDALLSFCENYLENCYPLMSKEDAHESNKFEQKIKIFQWMDEVGSSAMRHSIFKLISDKLQISFDEIEKVNSIGFYSRRSSGNIDNALKTKYNLFLKYLKTNSLREEFLEFIEICLEKFNKISEFLVIKTQLQIDFFFQIVSVLGIMQEFFRGLQLSEEKSSKNESHHENSRTDGGNFSGEDFQEQKVGSYENRNEIYEMIKHLATSLIEIEPHSPVPHFLAKLYSWKEKSFVEIAAELGLNSPMFDFLSRPMQQDYHSVDSYDD